MKKIFLIFLLVCSNCFAFDCDHPIYGIHFHTHHFNRNINFRENNQGFYFECENGFTAGSYQNSDWKQSTYVGYTQHMYVLDLTFMMISGYRTEPIPAIVPSIKFFNFIRIAYLPQSPTSQANTQGIHVSFEHKF